MNTTSRVCIGLFLIAHTLVFILAVLASGAAYFHFMYGPTKELELKVGKMNLLEYCDPTTDAFEDLLLTPDMSVKDAAYIGNTHGVVFVPNFESYSCPTSWHAAIEHSGCQIVVATHECQLTKSTHFVDDPNRILAKR
jgi:hypothetical protein